MRPIYNSHLQNASISFIKNLQDAIYIDCSMQVCYISVVKKNGLNGRRSDCPVNFAVEALGDKWSLVILRDMIFWGKKTYGEFLKSDEHIATNILADRLSYLEKEGLISKSLDPNDKRK